MNKKLLVAALGLAFAGIAQAQTNVVLYGRIDTAIQSTNSPNGRVSKIVGSESGTRWGMKGTEALAGNLHANFQLESGFNSDDGSLQGGLFNRIATVGLSGNFGAVDLGLKDSPLFNVLDMADPFGSSYSASPNYMQWLATNNGRGYSRRYSNQVSYTTPNFTGFQAQAMYALGENNTIPGTTKTRGDTFGFNATYLNGPIYVGAAYNRTKEDGSFNTPFTGAVSGVVPHKIKAVAGSFDFTVVKLFGAAYTDKRSAAPANGNVNVDQRVYWVGLDVPLTPMSRLDFTIGKVNDRTSPNRDARQYGLGFFHDLSRRTTLYTSYGNIKNDNVVFNSATTSVGSGYTSGGLTNSLNRQGKSSSFDFGVVHRF